MFQEGNHFLIDKIINIGVGPHKYPHIMKTKANLGLFQYLKYRWHQSNSFITGTDIEKRDGEADWSLYYAWAYHWSSPPWGSLFHLHRPENQSKQRKNDWSPTLGQLLE